MGVVFVSVCVFLEGMVHVKASDPPPSLKLTHTNTVDVFSSPAFKLTTCI